MRHTKALYSLAFALLFPAASFAGRSVVLTPNVAGTILDPNYPRNQSWRVEFQIHNIVLPPATPGVVSVFNLTGLGNAVFLRADGRLALEDDRDKINPQQPCFLSVAGYSNALVRVQRDLSAMRETCEMWNYDGTMYQIDSVAILSTNPWTSSSGTIGGNSTADLGFLRVFTTTVPLASRPPVTADQGNWTDLKFENNTNDSSGLGHNATVSGATYVTTPNQVAVAIAKTYGAPSWSNWTSLRAGHPSKLDGTSSFSLADATSAVSYQWRQIAGPSTVQWSNPGAAQPTVTGLIFGDYKFSLAVTDAAGSTAQTTLEAGAVAYDANGVVIPPNPTVTSIFGPQIAFGQNPWSYEDQKNQYAMNQMLSWFPANYDSTWETLGTGTVSYSYAGKGFGPGPACTTLASGITASSTVITVAKASCLDLSGLPATPVWILVGTGTTPVNGVAPIEMIRICSASGNTLTVCYDGRGVSGNNTNRGGYFTTTGASTWAASTPVGQFRINGTGTKFGTDSVRPVCPAGLPGPPGPVVYSTGTVTLSAGSTTITGSGNTWTPSMTGGFVRVVATHDGGMPFTFWAQITSFTDATHLVLNRPAPAGVDGTAFNYAITQEIYLMLQANSPMDNHVFNLLFNGVGCESETTMYAVLTHDTPALNSTVMPTTGTIGYSYKTALWYNNAGTPTPDFYGVGLAALMFYYRSGSAAAKTLSDEINPYITRDPEMADGIAGGGSALTNGGPVIGTMACLATGDCPTLALQILNGAGVWSQVEPFAVQGEIGSEACNADDTRDTGYQTAWLTMAANWDSNPTNRAAFTAALGPDPGTVLARDQKCKRNVADGYTDAEADSFANGFVWNPQGPVSLTNGSTTMTGSGFTAWTPSSPTTPATCYGVDEIKLRIVRGSSTAQVVNGSLTPQTTGGWSGKSPTMIWFYDGTKTYTYEYTFSGSTVQLSGVYTGATGTFDAMTTGGGEIVNGGQTIGGLMALWTDNNDNPTSNHALEESWACKQTSPTTADLFRPWPHASGTNYRYSYYNIQAFGQQPFMLGIKAVQINWAAQNSNVTTAAAYKAVGPLVGAWYNTYGWDANTSRGSFYDTLATACGAPTDVPAGSFNSIHSYEGCAPIGLASQAASIGRTDSVEGGNAMQLLYAGNPTPANKAAVDNFYGAIYGAANTCAQSVASTCDGTVAAQLATLSGPKWPGFFFGTGGLFSSSWPAIRAGTQPASMRTVTVSYTLGTATSAQVIVTAPSGAVTATPCAPTLCIFAVDDRQGSHFYAIQFLSSGSSPISTTAPVLLPLPPQP